MFLHIYMHVIVLAQMVTMADSSWMVVVHLQIVLKNCSCEKVTHGFYQSNGL